MPNATLLGLRTAIYFVPDLDRAKTWYQSVLDISPYYDTPYYVGFNVGGFELGLHPLEGRAPAGPGDVVAYWGVEHIDEAWKRWLAHGGRAVSEPTEVGEGIRVATIADPFGNPFGLIENPHFPNKA